MLFAATKCFVAGAERIDYLRPMLLEVQELSYSIEEKEVLKNVSFEVQAAKITSVLGANGSGKSTLLRLMAGLLDTGSGKILFQSEKVRGPSCRLVPGQPGVALVRQDNRLFPMHTVRDNLLYVLRAYEEEYQTEKIAELTELLGLAPNLDRVLKFLSGGEQQRVAIAAALASGPELLLMDEPFSQTDMYLKQQLREYLVQVVLQLGVGLLFVTHDPQDALSLSDEIMVLDQGHIIESGQSKSLYYHPQHKATAMLTGYCNWLPVGTFASSQAWHRIGEEYLLRPDQFTILPESTPGTYQAKVVKVEFAGFYQIIHLLLVDLNIEVTVTQITSAIHPKVGEVVWVRLG